MKKATIFCIFANITTITIIIHRVRVFYLCGKVSTVWQSNQDEEPLIILLFDIRIIWSLLYGEL